MSKIKERNILRYEFPCFLINLNKIKSDELIGRRLFVHYFTF